MSFGSIEGLNRFSEEEQLCSLMSQSLKTVNPGNHYTDLSLVTIDIASGLVIARHQKDGSKLPATNSREERLLETFTTYPYPLVRRLYYYPEVIEDGLVWDKISELQLADRTGRGFLPVHVEKVDFSRGEKIGIDLFQDNPKQLWADKSFHPWVQQLHYTSEALHRTITLSYNAKGQLNYLFVNATSTEGEDGEHGYMIGDPDTDGIDDARYLARLRELEDDGQDGAHYRFWKPQTSQLSIEVLTGEEAHRITLPMISNPGRVLVDACHPLVLIRPIDPSPELDEGWKGADFLMAANISWVSSPR